jgi:hypothetical protein
MFTGAKVSSPDGNHNKGKFIRYGGRASMAVPCQVKGDFAYWPVQERKLQITNPGQYRDLAHLLRKPKAFSPIP